MAIKGPKSTHLGDFKQVLKEGSPGEGSPGSGNAPLGKKDLAGIAIFQPARRVFFSQREERS